jgi:hypothetical protein
METLSSFARTQGAVDRQERKKRNVLGYGYGSVATGAAGIGAATYLGNKANQAGMRAYDETDKAYRAAKGTMTGDVAKNMNKNLAKKYGFNKNRNLAYGALGLGALGAIGLSRKAYANQSYNNKNNLT